MYYELWDLEVGRGLARYHDEQEMASLVQTLIGGYGQEYADALDLTIEDGEGVVHEQLSGQPLIAWSAAIVASHQGSERDNQTSATKARPAKLRQHRQRSTSSSRRSA